MKSKIHPAPPLVSLVVNDLAENAFGRAFLLGKMLEAEFRIEVVGFAGGTTWAPCADHGWPEKRLDLPPAGKTRQYINKLSGMVEGDIIMACKALPAVLDVAGRAAKRLRRPRLLDIDDWELGWFYPLRLRKFLSLVVRTRSDPNGFVRCWRAETRSRQWPVRLVSNFFLQKRFGGIYIPHACDTEILNPAHCPDREEACRRLGLDRRIHWVGFVGSPKPHKGVDILVKAVADLGRKEIGILLAGVRADNPEIRELAGRYGKIMEIRPSFPKERLGEILAALDLAALPQRDTPGGRGQIPAKVFDAMAMEIPVIASAVSDLPRVLEGCGMVVPPGDTAALAREIGHLIDDPRRRRELGKKGRSRCQEKYSMKVVGVHLRQAVWEALGVGGIAG